ncbi:MAG: hypothetical protein ACO1RX_17400 [Candidatus Sericytochromatia bacterium]
MNMTAKTAQVALSLCMSFSLLTACGPGPNDGMVAQPTMPTTAAQPGQVSSASNASMALQAQTALASYHEVDASFSDTQRLARSGQFRTMLLGDLVDDLLGDDEDNDSEDNDNEDNDTGSSANVGIGIDANVGADLDSDSDSNSGSGSGSASVGIGANVGADLDSDNDGGSGSANVGVGANVDTNVNTNTNNNSNSGSGSANVGVGANLGANLDGDDGDSSLNLNTDLNADINTRLRRFNDSSNRFRSQLQGTGAVSFDDSGVSDIDRSRIQTNVMTQIDADTDLDLLDDLNIDSNASAMANVSSDNLFRLRNRGFNSRFGSLNNRTNADGSVNAMFAANFTGNGTDRDVFLSDRLRGDASLGADLMLREQGEGFERDGSRVSEVMADGSLRVMTTVNTRFEDGSRLEIFEDRFTDVQGNGTGTGTIRMTDRNGNSTSGDLRTMVTADGSLKTFFDSDNGDDLMIWEDASGRAQLSLISESDRQNNRNSAWTQLDLNAALRSMTTLDS